MRLAALMIVVALWLGPRNATPRPLAVKPW
jgi:hypothetical protein